MKRACSILGLIAACVSPLHSQSSVWKVSHGKQTLYLGGTCHVLRSSDFPLPVEFDKAFAASDTLVFEIDPAAALDPQFGMQLMMRGSYQDGRSLKTVLSEEAYNALAAQGKKSNLPIEVLNGIKPGVAVMMISVQELAKIGVTQEGVDFYYHKQGLADGKAIRSLESPEFQIGLITEMGEGTESEFVLYSLKDLDQMSELFDELIQAWRIGDTDTLRELFVEDMKAYPKLYEDMLARRNRNWIPQIESMLESTEIEFVLVGAGHLVGDDGVITLLEQKGYKIEQVYK
ncbi:MAG: TraB/GumN family protein [Verrucomicrobiota bacterium]